MTTTKERTTELTAMVIVWSRDEPQRIGEALLFDPKAVDPLSFGRGEGEGARAILCRQRPGQTMQTGPLGSRHISRRQLRIEPTARGSLQIENVGRRTLLVNGRKIRHREEVRPGDYVELRGHLSFLVTRRPRVMPEIGLAEERWPEFGRPDGWGIVGESPATWQLRGQIFDAGVAATHTLVTGPRGAGKELTANAIHQEWAANRADLPLLSRRASSAELGEELAASSPATLFLDDVEDLAPDSMAKLLDALAVEDPILRVIAASSRRPDALPAELVERCGVQVSVAGLAERRDDIGLLVPALVREAVSADGASLLAFFPQGDPNQHPRVDSELVQQLVVHEYIHNVRELEGMLWTAMMQSAAAELRHVSADEPMVTIEDRGEVDPASLSREQLAEALDAAGGDEELAWRTLGLRNRFQLAWLLRKHGLGPESSKDD